MERLDRLIRDLLRQVLAIVRDGTVEERAREKAALLARTLVKELSAVTPDDVDALVQAAANALDTGQSVAHSLASAILARPPDPDAALAAVRGLARQAMARGSHKALAGLVPDILQRGADVEPEWMEAALAGTLAERRIIGPAMLLSWWLQSGGAMAPGLCALVREHEEKLLCSHHISHEMLNTIHAAEPTVTGWYELVDRVGEEASLPVDAEAFGIKLRRARETLAAAMADADPPTRVAFARWLVELCGREPTEE